eukprot:scaffold29022_cov101-Isochrysis_galbana.AAC.1
MTTAMCSSAYAPPTLSRLSVYQGSGDWNAPAYSNPCAPPSARVEAARRAASRHWSPRADAIVADK